MPTKQKSLTPTKEPIIDLAHRAALLEECENSIRSERETSIDALMRSFLIFRRIHDEELWRVNSESFAQYCEQYWGYTLQGIRMHMQGANEYFRLKATYQGELLPPTIAVIKPLLLLPEEMRTDAWDEVVRRASDRSEISAKTVGHLVDAILIKLAGQEGQSKRLVGADNGEIDPDDITVQTTARSQDAMDALDQIADVCGEEIAEAISNDILRVGDGELIKWAALETKDEMRAVGRYITAKRWSIPQAIKFMRRAIDQHSTVYDLINVAIGRGGKASVIWGKWKIKIEEIE
jgi:hypothetical protein